MLIVQATGAHGGRFLPQPRSQILALQEVLLRGQELKTEDQQVKTIIRFIQRAFLTQQPDSELVKLLKDDAYAMTFQSIGQYRSALINAAGGQQCD